MATSGLGTDRGAPGTKDRSDVRMKVGAPVGLRWCPYLMTADLLEPAAFCHAVTEGRPGTSPTPRMVLFKDT